jgi:hypothetical protein
MNTTMKCSSIFKLSYHLYNNAYELEYSFHVIIVMYELAYSLCVMILTCLTLSLIIHMTCMNRNRARLGWRFVVPSGLPISFTFRSIGSGTHEVYVVFLYTGVVLGYTGTCGYDGIPRLRGRR